MQGLYTNDIVNGREVRSIYQTPELRRRLWDYKKRDSLIVSDVDDTIAREPTKAVVKQSLPKIWRWIRHPEWGIDMARILKQAYEEGWSEEERNDYAIKYANAKVLTHFHPRYQDMIVREESPPLFPGVADIMRAFPLTEKLLVTKTFDVVARHYADILRIENYMALSKDKGQDIIDFIAGQPQSFRRVLQFGDLRNDALAARRLRQEGLDVDFVQVTEGNDIFPEATIVIPQDWRVLKELVWE